jgi:sodium-dependent phosphate transporter
MFNSSKAYIAKELTQEADFHVKEGTDATVSAIHDNGTKHDEATEEMFKYIQIFTAIINSFTHGANDVANAMGPFAAVFFTWKNNKVIVDDTDIGDDMYWILALGNFFSYFRNFFMWLKF